MEAKLEVKLRQDHGRTPMKRLREAGRTPAVIYGHGEPNVSISVPTKRLDVLVHGGVGMITLDGDISETAIIKDLQWNPLGNQILHIDLMRVSKTEAVEVTVAVHTHGVAPGIQEGGMVDIHLHEIGLKCPAGSIPEEILVEIGELHLGDSIAASELKLPEGATFLGEPEEVVVSCREPMEEPEPTDEEPVAEGGQPEVIGRSEEEDEESDS
jgi:large subunit ribosomal protein L25